jgi:KaiC/GvpD/RAD55 family RecA-like ATPase
MVDLALSYAAHGFRVFPLNGKAPAIPGGSGCLDATTDADVIREMWNRYPHANVGLAAGPESGFFAIDLDGPDARRAWMKLVEAHGAISTRCARTGREEGGLHMFFRWPTGGVPNRPEGAWSERVLGHRRMGVIADGRYVVGVGSIHPDTGQQYDWDDERVEIAEAPAWLVAKIRDVRPRPARDPWELPATPAGDWSSYNLATLDYKYETVARAPEGERINSLFRETASLANLCATTGMSESDIRNTMIAACRANGLWETDGERRCCETIRNGIERGKQTPWMPDSKDGPVHTFQQPDSAPAPELSTPDMAAVCRSLPGKHKRIRTYCEPLDAATGAGFQTGRIIAIGGPPGVTKTGWALAMSYAMARLGVQTSTGQHEVHVHVFAADEPRDGLLSRLGQMEGVTRSDLEDEDPFVSRPAWELLATRLAAVPQLSIWDPRVERVTVEDVAAHAARRARADGARLVLVIDSIQQAPFACDDPRASTRERVEARMRALRRISVEHDACIIAISELNRSAYSGREAKADLGSFKEAGGIEYTADLAMTLARVADPDLFLVQVTLHKSRFGDEPGFRLRRTPQCTFEVHSEPEAVDLDATVAEEARLEKLCNELVLALVRSKGPVTTRNDLVTMIRAKRQDAQAAVSRLITSGRIEGGKGTPFRVSYATEDTG